MADVLLFPPVTGGGSYTPPTYTPGSVLFADGAGAPTQDNAEFFYDGNNLLIGTNTGANGRLYIKAADDVTGNLIYAQNNANDTFFRVRNLSSAVQDAYITATLDTNQNDATILFLSSTISNTPRFNFYADGWLQFSGAGQMGIILPAVNNALAITSALTSGGLELAYASNGTYNGDSHQHAVNIGASSTYSGTGITYIDSIHIEGTFNQTGGATGHSCAIHVSSTLQSIVTSYTGFDFEPVETSVAALYGIRIRSTAAASAFGHNAAPDAFVHVGAATATGIPQFKFTLGGTILTTPENGTLECNNTHLYWTDSSGNRHQLDQQGGAGLTDADYGDITVSGGGTIMTIDNMSSATLAGKITDETGTGVLVFGTSPTFTTSVIGGATMAVFNTVSTNVSAFGAATNLNIGNTVTSTQAIAIGGQVTGVQTITIGAVPAVNPTGNQTITIGGGASSAGGKLITIGINGGVGSTTEVEIGSSTTGTTFKLNLSSSDATGDMLYKSSATTISRLAIGGTAGMVLTTLGGVPTWSANFGTTSGVITASTIELGHATANTLSASGGILSIEGIVIPTISSTHTLTNKRVNPRAGSTTSSATPTINTDNFDTYHLTAQTADITSFTTNLSGTPVENQEILISVTGTAARAITWGASFAAGAVALPTTTVTTERLDTKFKWSVVASKWMAMASGSYADA